MATFQLDLVAPDRLTFQGEVDQVDLPGMEGDFGVLAGHAPTVALLRPGILRVTIGGTVTQFVVMGGFAEVSPQGTLTVLADTAATTDEFDRAALGEQISQLETRIRQMPQDSVLDREIQRLDHYKQVDLHLQGTAMH
jgi:F-type H+-transporting ATPase subunit epsilon